jgi:hypothetical protein
MTRKKSSPVLRREVDIRETYERTWTAQECTYATAVEALAAVKDEDQRLVDETDALAVVTDITWYAHSRAGVAVARTLAEYKGRKRA